MNDFIDIYCERTAQGFWNEPLNALTNAAFLLAAFCAYRLARRDGALDTGIGFLIAVMAAIGIGSFLFHTLATGWAQLADVIPILIFQIGFIYLYGRQVIGLPRVGGLGLLGGFLVAVYLFGQLPPYWLNGSVGYGPAFLFLGGLGAYHYVAGKKERFVLLAATGVFALSLTFRTFDAAWCGAIPFGVHFLWHMLNGAVLYLAARSVVVAGKR